MTVSWVFKVFNQLAFSLNLFIGCNQLRSFNNDIVFFVFRVHIQIFLNYIIITLEMEPQKKRQQFTVSIRRKKINHSMQALRSMIHQQKISQSSTFKQYRQILENLYKGNFQVKDKLSELKVLSWEEQSAQHMIKLNINKLIENYVLSNHNISDGQYNDVLTIFINIFLVQEIQFHPNFLLSLVQSILVPARQMNCLWLLSNMIYKRSLFSQKIVKEFVQNCNTIDYMENRVNKHFEIPSILLIFNFFCCSFLTVAKVLSYEQYMRILNVIETIQKFQGEKEDNFFLFTFALIEHSDSIAIHNYTIFSSSLMNNFYEICKKKKTKLIKNYLKFLKTFCESDNNAYEKFLQYKIFMNLNFCLQNRFPEVKILCAQISTILLKKFKYRVDLENIDFFGELGMEFINFQKYNVDGQLTFLVFGKQYFSSLKLIKVSSQQKKQFIEALPKIIEILGIMISTCNGNIALIFASLDLLQIFMTIDINNYLKHKCETQNIPYHLNHFQTQNQELKERIDKFLQIF